MVLVLQKRNWRIHPSQGMLLLDINGTANVSLTLATLLVLLANREDVNTAAHVSLTLAKLNEVAAKLLALLANREPTLGKLLLEINVTAESE